MGRPATAATRLLSGEREPCRVATTGNIVLQGLQTIDSHALAVNDRVIVKDQTDARQNGIYTASTGPWYRASDARDPRSITEGVTVQSQAGLTNGGKAWRFATPMPNIGDDAIVINFYLSATFSADAAAIIEAGLDDLNGAVTAGVATIENAATTALSDLDTAGDVIIAEAQAVADSIGGFVPNSFPPTRTVMAAQADTIAHSYLTEGDRGGLFELKTGNFSAAVAADVSQGMVVPTADDPTGLTKAHIRLNPEYLTPGFFGVGSNDPFGDHDREFQDIAWALAGGYGKKHLVIDRPCRVPDGWSFGTSGVWISAVGDGILYCDLSSTYHAISGYGVSDILITDLPVEFEDGGVRANTMMAFYFYQSSRIRIGRCSGKNALAGIWTHQCDDVVTRDNVMRDTRADGIHFAYGSQRCWSIDDQVYGAGDDAFSTTTYASGTRRASDINFINPRAHGGFWGAGVAVYGADDVAIVNPKLSSTPGPGINISTMDDLYPGHPNPTLAGPASRVKISGGGRIFNPGTAQEVYTGDPITSPAYGAGICGLYVDDLEIGEITIDTVAASPVAKSGIYLQTAKRPVVKPTTVIRTIVGTGIKCVGDVTEPELGGIIDNTDGYAIDLGEANILHDSARAGLNNGRITGLRTKNIRPSGTHAILLPAVNQASGEIHIDGFHDANGRGIDQNAWVLLRAQNTTPTHWRTFSPAFAATASGPYTKASETGRWTEEGSLIRGSASFEITALNGGTGLTMQLPFTPADGVADVHGSYSGTGASVFGSNMSGATINLYLSSGTFNLGVYWVFFSFARV